jgi:hypothetical protein
MITASIDLRKIDQSKCKSHTNGAKYCELVLIETPNGKFGNTHMVVQGVSKEDRANGIKGVILGNAKVWESRGAAPAKRPPQGKFDDIPSKPSPEDGGDGFGAVPF